MVGSCEVLTDHVGFWQVVWGSGKPIIKPTFTPAFAANTPYQHCLRHCHSLMLLTTSMTSAAFAGIQSAFLRNMSAVSANAQPAVPLKGNHRHTTLLPA